MIGLGLARMTLMAWNDEMTVGVKAMDDDHKRLIEILNEMQEAIAAGDDRKILGAALERLVEYTKGHLAREEKLLAQCDYPDSTEHHKEHDAMIAKALIAQANFRVGSSEMLTIEMMNFLSDWLTEHIQGSDRLYGPYLNSHGIH